MIIGSLFILAGILIALYPPLLAFIVALSLVLLGIVFVYLSLYYRKMTRKFNDPVIDFIFRL
jgi:hypothetical protein